MKSRYFISLLLTVLSTITLTACGTKTIDNRKDMTEDIVTEHSETEPNESAQTTPDNTKNTLTQAEAESIALEHAGLSADQIRDLYTEYDIDDGIQKYEVRFYHDYLEYDYDIDAETGAILSFDKDN